MEQPQDKGKVSAVWDHFDQISENKESPSMSGDQSHPQDGPTQDGPTQDGQTQEGQTQEGQTTGSVLEVTPGEQPQCMMGGRQVDNMCFMISCTNWY